MICRWAHGDAGDTGVRGRALLLGKALGHAATVLGIALGEMVDHPLPDVVTTGSELADEVPDELIPLPVGEGAVALSGLLVVVLATDGLPHDAPKHPGAPARVASGRTGPVRGWCARKGGAVAPSPCGPIYGASIRIGSTLSPQCMTSSARVLSTTGK